MGIRRRSRETVAGERISVPFSEKGASRLRRRSANKRALGEEATVLRAHQLHFHGEPTGPGPDAQRVAARGIGRGAQENTKSSGTHRYQNE